MRQVNVNVLSAPDNASANGNVIDSNQLFAASFQAVFGDVTAAGNIQIQASNDISAPGAPVNSPGPTNWTNITGATATVTAGASVLVSLSNINYRFLRVVWTNTSGGSTTINVNMFAQSV